MPVGPANVKAHNSTQFTEVNDILEAREVNFALILCAVIHGEGLLQLICYVFSHLFFIVT